MSGTLTDALRQRLAAIRLAHDPAWSERVLLDFERLRFRKQAKLDRIVNELLTELEAYREIASER